ncbi:10967_t:CDS:2 [Paraglomus occultum]|uniref:10967_t:CDS:1 n=1 Tax=Paraglomus occultum TaxID=144539 RepID=A0A9N9F921_9GLOM|nr:10967_t:CDS:2 [Paraglomus occultum]
MAANLPPEILSMILNACAYDKETLHACILTNRIWHIVAIRHLWARPFTLLYNKRECYIKSRLCKRKAESLLTTFIRSITDVKEIKKDVSVLTKKYEKKPPFNYNVYLKEIHFYEVWSLVRDWCTPYGGDYESLSLTMRNSGKLAVKIVCLAILYCQHLRTFTLEAPKRLSYYQQISEILMSVKSLPHLRICAFKLSGVANDKMLELFSRFSHNLESLSVDFQDRFLEKSAKTSLQKLIQTQRYLKTVHVKRLSTTMASIFELLNVKSNCLESIILLGVKFQSGENMQFKPSQFRRVKSIDLRSCKIPMIDTVKPMIETEFPHLQELTFRGTEMSCEILRRILEKHGGKLFSEYEFPHLYNLELHDMSHFEPTSLESFLLNSKPSLRSLIIDDTSRITDAHLKILLKYLGRSLRTLKFKFNGEQTSMISHVSNVIAHLDSYVSPNINSDLCPVWA